MRDSPQSDLNSRMVVNPKRCDGSLVAKYQLDTRARGFVALDGVRTKISKSARQIVIASIASRLSSSLRRANPAKI